MRDEGGGMTYSARKKCITSLPFLVIFLPKAGPTSDLTICRGGGGGIQDIVKHHPFPKSVLSYKCLHVSILSKMQGWEPLIEFIQNCPSMDRFFPWMEGLFCTSGKKSEIKSKVVLFSQVLVQVLYL